MLELWYSYEGKSNQKRGTEMEVVESIAKEKVNYYKVTLTSGRHFFVSEDILVRYRLLKGTELSDEDIQTVKKQTQLDYGYQQALNYLSYQLRSKKEIRDYLKKQEIDSASSDEIIKRLEGLNLVDDLVYAESYVRTQMRLSDKGPRVLRDKLKQRGIPEMTIEQAMALYAFDGQLEVAVAVAEKAARKYKAHSFSEKNQKIRQYLMTKGFSGDCITEALAALELEKDEEVEADILVIQGDKLWRKNQRFDAKKRKQKVTQSLYQKGFSFDVINEYIAQKEMEDEEE